MKGLMCCLMLCQINDCLYILFINMFKIIKMSKEYSLAANVLICSSVLVIYPDLCN